MLGEETPTMGVGAKMSSAALRSLTGQGLDNAIQGMTTLGFGVKLVSAASEKPSNTARNASGPDRTADMKARQTPSAQQQKSRAPGMGP